MSKVSKQPHIFAESKFVCEVMETLGEARVVGGYVRDFVAKRPCKDVDIATPHSPERVIELLSDRGIKVIPTGIKHGTVTAVGKNKESIEITTLRKDIECFGREAEVEFTDSWEEDAARRDFTMNAMSMDIDENIYDYFDGQQDLKKGVVKFVGEPAKRVEEDYLRILRYFRFEAGYGSHAVDKESLKACIANKSNIQNLSGERIQNEMFKLLGATDPFFVLTLMKEEGVLTEVLYADTSNSDVGAIRQLVSIEKNEGSIIPSKDSVIRLALLITEGAKQAKEICENWKLSNADKRQLLDLIEPVHDLSPKMDERAQKRMLIDLGKEDFIRQLVFEWSQDDENIYLSEWKMMLAIANTWSIPEFPLQGKDVLELGVAEGEEVGDILSKAHESWEESDYSLSKQDLLTLIKKEI